LLKGFSYMAIYQVTLLAVKPGTPKALNLIGGWVQDAGYRGQLLACWQSEFGVLGQVMLLHGYDELESMFHDRDKFARSVEGYGIGDALVSVSTKTYQPFPMFGPLEPGTFGPFFEVRTYLLAMGTLDALTERWEKALPLRMTLSKPLIVMYSTDGIGPQLLHIWPYVTLEDRDRIRASAVEQGIWPVRGAPGTIIAQRSEIFLPAAISPIQ
jgi:NIPSNAP